MKLANGMQILPCVGKYYTYDIKVTGEYEIVETIGHIARYAEGYRLILNTKKPYVLNISFRDFCRMTDLIRFLRKINFGYNCIRKKVRLRK